MTDATRGAPTVPPIPGHSFAEWEWLAGRDPVYEVRRRGLTALIWTPEDPALSVKHRELIASVILAYRAFPTVEQHMRRAISEGATLRELIEAFQAGALPGGLPLMHFALGYLIKLEEELGLTIDEVAAEPADRGDNPSPHGFSEWDWHLEQDPTYERLRRQLTAMVWTPENPALPVRMREIIAAAVLACRGYPTVDEHFRRALREGASFRELLEAMQTAVIPGGFPVMHFSLPYLIRLKEELDAGVFA